MDGTKPVPPSINLLDSSSTHTPSPIRDILNRYAVSHRTIFSIGYPPYGFKSDADSEDEDEDEDEDPSNDPAYIVAKFAYEKPPKDITDDIDDSRPSKPEKQTKSPLSVSPEGHQAVKKIKAILDSGIKNGKIQTPPSADFLNLCRDAIFVITSANALHFFKTLNPQLAETIHYLTITSAVLYGDDHPSRHAWSNDGSAPFTPMGTALHNLPNIKELSLFSPPGGSDDYYCTWALHEISKFLLDNEIQGMRLIFLKNVDQLDVWDIPALEVFTDWDALWAWEKENGESVDGVGYGAFRGVEVEREVVGVEEVVVRGLYGWGKVVDAFLFRKK